MIFFRVDGNKNIGLGHVYRCYDFIKRQKIKSFIILTNNKFDIQKIPSLKNKIIQLKSAHNNIKQIKFLKNKYNANLIVVDLPKLGSMYKNSLNNIFPKSLFIVDKLNQNLRNGYFLHPKITKTEKNIKNVYYGVSPFIKLKNRKLLNLKLKKKQIYLYF